MPVLTPQQKEMRIKERELNARFFKKQIKNGRYYRVDRLGEDEDELESLPGLSTATTLSKLLKPGVYTREDPVSKYDFRLNGDGSVVPLRGLMRPAYEELESVKSVLNWAAYFAGVGLLASVPVFGLVLPFMLDRSVYMNTVSEFDDKYGQTIDFLKIATGTTTMHLDWPDPKHVTERYIERTMELALEKNMVIEFGDNVEKFLDDNPLLRRKFAVMQLRQREKQALEFKKPEYLAARRQLDYNTNRNAIASKDRLTGTDADKKQQFEQALAANGLGETAALSKAVVDIDHRLIHAVAATKEVAGHVNSLTPADRAIYVQENGSDWQDLLHVVATEQADLQTRTALVQEKIAAQKAVIEAVVPAARTPEQTAQLTQLQQMEAKIQNVTERLTKLKNGDANTVGFEPLQQKVDALVQTTAPRARR